MSEYSLRVAVMSDLHAYDTPLEPKIPPSFLSAGTPDDKFQHPIAALLDLIERESLCADVVVCPGDLADKGEPAGARCGWGEVRRVADALGASDVVATAGNHDVDWKRHHGTVDADSELRRLPDFPVADGPERNRFWADGFAILDRPGCRIVTLNSTAHYAAPGEAVRGRVTDDTLQSVRGELERRGPVGHRLGGPEASVNMLVCHHHPHRYGDLRMPDYSEMTGGDQLIRMLGSGDLGTWIVVHGHKHLPRLAYASGDMRAPVVFAAGSLTAHLYPAAATQARNQFYILSFDLDEIARSDWDLLGTFGSYTWTYASGWDKAPEKSGLPARGGFGWRDSPFAVAREVAARLEQSRERFMAWDEIVALVPKLNYMLPSDVEAVVTRLRMEHRLRVLVFEDEGRRAYVGVE